MSVDNKSLGKFVLDGIPPAPRGVPQIEVIFDVDSNGVLKVTAKDKATGKEQSIRIEASSGLSEDEIERMKKEAEVHAADDEAKKALIDSRNMAEQLIYTAEKSLKDHGDKVPAETKTEIESKVTSLKEVREKDDKAAIDSKTEELSAALQKIGEKLEILSSKKSNEISGVRTGFRRLDLVTSGWQPSDLVVIAARPGMGKTSLVLKIMLENVVNEVPVGIVSLEMSTVQLVTRLVACNSHFHLNQLFRILHFFTSFESLFFL
jgi:replicative DNA helicase